MQKTIDTIISETNEELRDLQLFLAGSKISANRKNFAYHCIQEAHRLDDEFYGIPGKLGRKTRMHILLMINHLFEKYQCPYITIQEEQAGRTSEYKRYFEYSLFIFSDDSILSSMQGNWEKPSMLNEATIKGNITGFSGQEDLELYTLMHKNKYPEDYKRVKSAVRKVKIEGINSGD